MTLNFKLILRNLTSGKNLTFLNIAGLSIGLACALVILSKVKNELDYDSLLPDAGRIYRLTFETNSSGKRMHFARCWEPWVSRLPGRFPQIEELVRLSPYRHTAVKSGDDRLYSDRVFATDSNFFKVFGIDLLAGDANLVLKEPYSAVISATLAKRLFGDADPSGKTIMMSGEYDEKMIPFIVKGIMEDSPQNSHIHFDILTSYTKPGEAPDWAYVYLLFRNNTKPGDLLSQFPSFIREAEPDSNRIVFTPYLQNIRDIHLHSDKDREVEPNSNIANIYLYLLITLILLVVSWSNYFNLSMARLLTMKKQTTIQRINGAGRLNIIVQALTESAISAVLALLLSLFIIDLTGNIVTAFFGFQMLPGGFSDIVSLWPLIVILLIISTLAGSMPAISDVFKNPGLTTKDETVSKHIAGLSPYGLLLALQFFLSIGLIVSAIVIYRQKDLIIKGSLGKMNSSVLVFKKQNWEIRGKYKSFRDKAMQNPLIRDFTASMEEPTGETMDAMVVESSALDESHRDRSLYVLPVEDNFLDFFNISIIAGRKFSQYNPELKSEEYILNETAVKELGWIPEEAIGKPFRLNFSTADIFYGGTVVGVAKDFYFSTLKHEIKPYVLFQKPIFYLTFIVEVDNARKAEAIDYLKSVWEEQLPDYAFHFEFIDELYNSAYQKEFTQARLTGFFSVLAILIICIGLYSVTSVLIARRTKEIGIRRVNGASVRGIIMLLSSDFVIWFAIAFLMACPVSYLVINRWLQNFAYRVKTEWWYFILAGAIVLSVSFLTVFFKSIRAASVNPVRALRYE
jgi:putative ABC transport system permease protein